MTKMYLYACVSGGDNLQYTCNVPPGERFEQLHAAGIHKVECRYQIDNDDSVNEMEGQAMVGRRDAKVYLYASVSCVESLYLRRYDLYHAWSQT